MNHTFNNPETTEELAKFIITRLKKEYETEKYFKLLNTVIDDMEGNKLANIMVNLGFEFRSDDVKVLSISNIEGVSVAHMMVKQFGTIFEDESVLKLATYDGFTVAHILASSGYHFQNIEILSLEDKAGFTVGMLTEVTREIYPDNYFEILSIKSKIKEGYTVAHYNLLLFLI